MSEAQTFIPGNLVRLADRRPHPEAGGSGAGAFATILFPPGLEALRDERGEEPDCFVDLNLDQIVGAAVARRDEDVLRPIFHSPCRSEEVVRYRQAVFADLERPEIFGIFPQFGEAMRGVHANLRYAGEISTGSHRNTVILRAAGLYCEAIAAFLRNLAALELESEGLKGLHAYLADYARSPSFLELARETAAQREALSRVSFGMLFSGDRVKVRKYASEPDYTTIILDRFARFRESGIAPPGPAKPKDDFSLNHIEEAILEFVSRLFPEAFGSLEDYVSRQGNFIDEVVARFGREIGFYIAYLDFIRPLRRAGLPFCRPIVSASSKATAVAESFDLALATRILAENGTVVGNDFQLSGPERLLVVSGPNQGGKTTFARMFGQLHFLAGLGCPVPGKAARLFLPDRIFTHFEREEDIANLRGKLEDELVRLHRSCRAMTADSVVVLNEIFNSTSLDDQIFLSTQVLERILAIDAIGVCVTFLDPLSTISEKTVSMVSTVDPEEPARRTFRIVRKPADGLAYALSLAEKHGVTYAKLRSRVRP
ncbi:MutS-related protein [Bosea minatitlanensis]|uniref:DNA mismatch repair protein MutS n=1 Tax=Bosea minatitlanensis TaxID=128782 RepID=A0ABW0EYT1_9HYPH|nr:DNA mismatch repair protein MutS [Bosea minatitlanensis]MCT4492243.1 DNA mismatch repair protein MutS [Bosea minatitlanensis]